MNNIANTIIALLDDGFKVTFLAKHGQSFIEANKVDTIVINEGTKVATYTIQVPIEQHINLLQVDVNPFLSEKFRLDKLRI